MRTHDEKKMETSYQEVYIKENATASDKPLILWLSERIGKNLASDEPNRPHLLKLLKNLISAEQKRKRGKVQAKPSMPVSTAEVSINPDSFPKSSTVKESKSLKDAYQKVYLQEAEDPSDYTSGPHAKYYDPRYSAYSDKHEGFEFEHEGKTYIVDINYDIEETYDEGDGYYTPPSTDYEVNELEAYNLSMWDSDTGEYKDLDREQNPEAYDALLKIGEQKFLDNRSNWDPEY